MTAVSDRYRKNAAAFTARVASVPPDKWAAQSPCDEWKARDVVGHVVNSSERFLGFAGQSLPHGPSVDDDPLGAWTNARDAVQHGLDDPAIAQAEYDGMWGKATFEQGVNRFLAADLVVHSWDLARATGGDERLDLDEVRTIRASFDGFDPKMFRSPGAFGPELDAPPGADEQTKFLAFVGRRA
jgi:uncharacterized protein (TIGR03086 family)